VRRDRLQRILEAGATLLAERGFHGVTMRDLARSSGTSLANLYRYVADKEDLYYQVARRVLEAAVASAQAALAARGGRERLRAVVTDHVRRVLARPFEADALRGGGVPLRGERARRLEDLRSRYATLVRAAVDGALRTRPVRAREAELRVALLLGMADRLATDAARQRATPRPDRLAAHALGTFLDGMRGRRAAPS
jgi:AcrR family transcriptional regulator